LDGTREFVYLFVSWFLSTYLLFRHPFFLSVDHV
jgi:hypothetical protein